MFKTINDDDMVECPYNKYHQMTRKRLIPHLIKCRLSYPDAELIKCPFNASHLIPEPEFTHHVANCKDKAILHQYKYNTLPVKIDAEDRNQVEVDCDENWDDTEADDYDPKKYATQANVIRTNIGSLPSLRKEFNKSERKRLGDDDSSEDEAQKTFGKRIYKDMDCKAKEEAKEQNWFKDVKPSSSSRSSKDDGKRRDNYEESLKEFSKERGRDEDSYRKSTKKESRNSEEEGESSSRRNDHRRTREKEDSRSKRRRSEEHSLDDDPYYRTNYSRPSYLGMSRGGRRGYSYRK